ncbi:pentapeptide repeat-containing protein [Streptomyces olivochromogenes]|uniref:pentapeptide repeat-containing protein n=1 Tax=Streptomyces olivochromogenes TaxID=1963 RepID=UPI0036D9E558
MRDADLTGAQVWDADFTHANLSGADLNDIDVGPQGLHGRTRLRLAGAQWAVAARTACHHPSPVRQDRRQRMGCSRPHSTERGLTARDLTLKDGPHTQTTPRTALRHTAQRGPDRHSRPPLVSHDWRCLTSHGPQRQHRNKQGKFIVHLHVAAEGTVSPGLTYSPWGRSSG